MEAFFGSIGFIVVLFNNKNKIERGCAQSDREDERF